MLERLKQVEAHPFHKFLGVTSIKSENGSGEIVIQVSENVVNPQGTFHGGVIYTLCDVCAYGGLLSLLDHNTEAVTHDIQVSVMRAAMLGDTVYFNSEVVKMGRSICFLDVKATSMGKLIATARITKSLLAVPS